MPLFWPKSSACLENKSTRLSVLDISLANSLHETFWSSNNNASRTVEVTYASTQEPCRTVTSVISPGRSSYNSCPSSVPYIQEQARVSVEMQEALCKTRHYFSACSTNPQYSLRTLLVSFNLLWAVTYMSGKGNIHFHVKGHVGSLFYITPDNVRTV